MPRIDRQVRWPPGFTSDASDDDDDDFPDGDGISKVCIITNRNEISKDPNKNSTTKTENDEISTPIILSRRSDDCWT